MSFPIITAAVVLKAAGGCCVMGGRRAARRRHRRRRREQLARRSPCCCGSSSSNSFGVFAGVSRRAGRGRVRAPGAARRADVIAPRRACTLLVRHSTAWRSTWTAAGIERVGAHQRGDVHHGSRRTGSPPTGAASGTVVVADASADAAGRQAVPGSGPAGHAASVGARVAGLV
ncbi:MAG: hypothetical protein U5K74_06545 [Gemmatimonadaceae bacterium]|nr:hypothetical protein [Gemmatimonadaceae bacterium]